jgi:hypothetical protein
VRSTSTPYTYPHADQAAAPEPCLISVEPPKHLIFHTFLSRFPLSVVDELAGGANERTLGLAAGSMETTSRRKNR